MYCRSISLFSFSFFPRKFVSTFKHAEIQGMHTRTDICIWKFNQFWIRINIPSTVVGSEIFRIEISMWKFTHSRYLILPPINSGYILGWFSIYFFQFLCGGLVVEPGFGDGTFQWKSSYILCWKFWIFFLSVRSYYN